MLEELAVLERGAGAVTSKFTIMCNGCGKEISKQVPAQYLTLSASTMALLVEPKHFCNQVCLRAWTRTVESWLTPVRVENEDL